MNYIFNETYLSQIIVFLTYQDIISLSRCNKALKELLNPKKNDLINTIFMLSTIHEFFSIDKKLYNKENKNNLSGKKLKFDANFQDILSDLKKSFFNFKDDLIKQRTLDFIKVHIYLPDIRKEIFMLEFENSTTNQIINYDIVTREVLTYNYYSKYITFNYIMSQKGQIKILREKLLFEDFLINFGKLFNEFINKKDYIDFINNNVCLYKYEKLENMYNERDISVFHTNFINNININNIFKFILWINHVFNLYTKFNYEYIHGLSKDFADEELIIEFLSKKNELVNCALLISSSFENINIIINFLSIYKSIYEDYLKNHPLISSDSPIGSEFNIQLSLDEQKKYNNKIVFQKKFSLYNLFIKIIEEKFTSQLDIMKSKFKTLARDYFTEAFAINEEKNNTNDKIAHKMSIEEDIDDDDEYINAIKEEVSFDDLDDLSLDDKPTKKDILENFMNSMVDRYINGNNANGIMHSFFKMDDKYINDYENPLVECFKGEIVNNINNNVPLNQLFEKVEKITRCEGNSRTLFSSKDSLSVIRRTKFKLMIQGYSIIFKNLMEALVKDFDSRIAYDENTNERKIFLNAYEKIKSPEYKLNMDALSEIGEKNVHNNIKEEKEKAINYLMKETKFKDIDRTLVEEFFKTLKIDYVLLFKKVLLNYYKQLEIYKERNEKVVYFIKNKQKFVNAKDCYNNKEENKDDYRLSAQECDKIINI